MPRILGREPALWLALVAVTVKLVSAFVVEVSAVQQTWINAVAAALVGLIVAVQVGDGAVAALLGLVHSALALAVGYGLDWSADRQAVVLSFTAALVGMFVRTQVTAPVPASARRLPAA